MPVCGRPAGRRSGRLRRVASIPIVAVALTTLTLVVVLAAPAAADPLLPEPNPVDSLTRDLLGIDAPGQDAIGRPEAPGALAPPLSALPPLPSALGALLPPPLTPWSSPTTPAGPAALNAVRTDVIGPLLHTGRLRAPDTNPILELARSSTALLALALSAAVFLALESVFAHRNPRVTTAPIDRRDGELEFT